MVNSKFYQLGSPEFSSQLQILCQKAKKRKQYKPIRHWQGRENFEFSEYRKYSPGDDLRKVDWNIYQRLKEVMVKEYELEPPKHLVVMLDTSHSMVFHEKFLYAKALVAMLMYIGATILDKVTFLSFPSNENEQSFSNNKGMLRFFDFLQNLPACDNNKNNLLCSQILRSHHLHCIVVSDFYKDEHFSSLGLLKCIPTAIQVLSKQEIKPITHGYVCLQDAESKKKKDLVVDRERLNIYFKNLHNHLQKVKHHCKQNKVNYFLAEEKSDFSSVLNILQVAGIIK